MDKDTKNEGVMYARVSSREQEETGYSLPAQEKLMLEYCERKDVKVKKIFSIAESASGAKERKTFAEMMEHLRKKKINILICEKVDRITRNFKEALIINDWIEEDPNRQIHFVKQNLIIHQNAKSDEKFRWDIEIVLAKKYISNLSEEVKKGQAEKVSQGWLPTKPPIGYKTVGDEGHKIHIINDEVAVYIKELFAFYATGNYSLIAAVEKMYELGFRSKKNHKVGKSTIHNILSDPFYYGNFMWKGKIYKGNHDPIISKDLFDQVKTKMTKTSSPYYNKHITELRGKVFCGNCSKTITWEKQKGQTYGGCKACKSQIGEKNKYIHQEKLESELLARIVSIAPKNDRVMEILSKALKESHSEEIERHDTQVKNINNQLVRIQQRMREMYDDKLDKRISGEMYDDKVKQFDDEKTTLLSSLEKLESDNTEYYRIGFSVHELALRAKEIYLSEKATIEERRMLLSYAFSKVTVLHGKITPEYTKPFNFLSEWMPRVNTIFELENSIGNKGRSDESITTCPTLLGYKDSNLD